jgi:hypothetical protein
MAFKPVGGTASVTYKKFKEVGDSVEGYYIGSDVQEGNYGPQDRHLIKTKDGSIVAFNGGPQSLDSRMAIAKKGLLTRVTLSGIGQAKRKGMSPPKFFLVVQDDEDTIPVEESTNEKSLG